MNNDKQTGRIALVIGAVLSLFSILCILWILRSPDEAQSYTATIYRDGTAVISVCLSEVTSPYTLDITNKDGSLNQIEIRPGEIGMISASCPDKLCVRQGFISSSRIPITCLPNHVVIVVRPTDSDDSVITY